ncbi:MAG: alcohol dehydrogenase catalytic domain-containing protein [Candidatus Bathyarchaeia archaeon]
MISSTEKRLIGKRVVFVRKGEVTIEDFEVPQLKNGEVLIQTVSSLISSGTETAFLMALPNTPGVFPQYPGYSNAGIIIATGNGVSEFKVGDRVVSQRSHASHAIAPQRYP